MSEYTFDISQCDVCDKDNLLAYRSRRCEWRQWIQLDPLHSIFDQTTRLAGNYLTWSILNEARSFGEGSHSIAAQNGLLGDFLDDLYVSSQIVAICRLTDRDRDVISLHRLIDDLSKHRKAITREVFVSHDGLPFDPDESRDRFYGRSENMIRLQLRKPIDALTRRLPTKGADAFSVSERLHRLFDILSHKSREQRRRDDVISLDTIEDLKNFLGSPEIQTTKNLRHKLFAHAADEKSRSKVDAHGTFGQIEDATAQVLSLCNKLSDILIFETCSAYPHLGSGSLKGLDKPFVPPGALPRLRGEWHRIGAALEARIDAAEHSWQQTLKGRIGYP